MKRFYILLLFFPLTLSAQYSVPLAESNSGNKHLTANVDGITVDFIFDTGCSSLSINQNIFDEMVRSGVIRKEDLSEETESEIANGTYSSVRRFYVKRLQIGDCVLYNIHADVGVNDRPDASPLLGQTVLERFASYTVANNRLYFTPKSEQEQNALYVANRWAGDTTMANNRKIVDALTPYAQNLSPRYLAIYANALEDIDEYEQAISIYRHLIQSDAYAGEKDELRQHLIHSELQIAKHYYAQAMYAECEQVISRVLQHSTQRAIYSEGLDYAHYLLCYVHMLQEDYELAEQSVLRYADYLLAPQNHEYLQNNSVKAKPELAQMFFYLSEYFNSIGDTLSAQRYKRYCTNVGGYSPKQ